MHLLTRALAPLCLVCSAAGAADPLEAEVAAWRAAVGRARASAASPAAAVAALATARAALDAALETAGREADRLLDAAALASRPDPALESRIDTLERARDLGALELADGLARAGSGLPEGAAERDALLADAVGVAAALASSSAPEGVCAWATLIRAEALLELGRAEEALGAAGELLDAAGGAGPEPDLVLGALRCRARALVLLSRPGEASGLPPGLEPALGTGWRERPLARLLELELAKAEALAGAPEAGARRLLAAIEAARKDPERARGIEAAATRALSELSDLGARLPAAALLQAASGYQLRGRPELALVALKSALAAARGQERAAIVPRAAWDAGALLLRDERWLEAALALELLVLEAPRDERTPAAARAALQAARRGCEELGAAPGPALDGWVRELARRAAEVDPEAGARELLRRAAEHEGRGEWAEAAALWAQVRSEPARLRLAVCQGRLELRAGRPREALARVASLGAAAPLAAVRIEVEARLALGELEQADERFQAALSHEEPGLGGLALVLAQGLRAGAIERFARDKDPLAARGLRERAARAAEVWLARTDAATLGPEATWLAGTLLLEGGRLLPAAEHLARGLLRFAGQAAPEELDLAEQRRAWALARAGRSSEALAHLRRLRDAVEVRDPEGRLVGRGRQISRELRGPFPVRRQGRAVTEKRWVVTLELDGRATRFWEVADPRAGGLEVRAVEGGDTPRPTWAGQEERTLRLHLRRAFLVVDGLARASWAEWERSKDAALLAGEATAAANERLLLLRGLSEATWAELAATLPVGPPELSHATWEAELAILRVKMARQEWAAVRSDLRLIDLLRRGAREKAPPAVQEGLAELERELSRRGM